MIKLMINVDDADPVLPPTGGLAPGLGAENSTLP